MQLPTFRECITTERGYLSEEFPAEKYKSKFGKKYMKKFFVAIAVMITSFCCYAKDNPQPVTPPVTKELSVEWDRVNITSWKGGYCRVHRLNDSRLMAVYESGGKAYCRFSSNNGTSWTSAAMAIDREQITSDKGSTWANNSNSEFAQLRPDNPYHPGRIIFAVNIRPSDKRSDIYPYSIGYAVSDDNGKTWSERRIAFQSEIWSSAVGKGCWEPFVLELPDGTVQIYFSDETPYYRQSRSYQNISVIESKDGGDSWSKARIVAFTDNHRDGMPVVMLLNDNLYLAIEHLEDGERFHPEIVWNPVCNNWDRPVYCPSSYRFDPLREKIDYIDNYFGAPYLISTDNYIVLSYQSSEGSSVPDSSHSVMEVVVCPKSEIKKNLFKTMRCATRPVLLDQTKSCARWNSLCDLGDDNVLAVSDVSGTIYLTKGKISGK